MMKLASAFIAGAGLLFSSAGHADVYIGLQQNDVNAGLLIQVAQGVHAAHYSGGYGAPQSFFNIQTIDVTDQGAIGDKLISSAIDILGTAPKTLYIYVTATGQTGNPVAFRSALASTSIAPGGMADLATFYDDGDGIFAATTSLAGNSYAAPGTDDYLNLAGPLTDPYSITGVYTIHWPGRTLVPFEDSIRVSAIPEPATLMLLGGALVLLGMVMPRRPAQRKADAQ